jgi:hypothetical protein
MAAEAQASVVADARKKVAQRWEQAADSLAEAEGFDE